MFSYDYILDGLPSTDPRALLETQISRLTQLIAQALSDVPPVSKNALDWSHSGIIVEGSAYLPNALLRVHPDPYPAFVIGFSAVLDGQEKDPKTFGELWQMVGQIEPKYQSEHHSLILWISSDETWTRLHMRVGTESLVLAGEYVIIRSSMGVPSGVDPTDSTVKMRNDTRLIPTSALLSWAYSSTQFAPDFLDDDADSIEIDDTLKGRSDSLFRICFEYAPIVLRENLHNAFEKAIGAKVS
jgi:hypothetical protein